MKLFGSIILSHLKVSCTLGLLLMGNFLFAQQLSNYDSIDTAIATFMYERKIPGFAACTVKGSTVIWSKAYGQADIQHKEPMNLDGIMNIGSISKTFTTTAAMQLWEKGLLELNADINEYVDFEVRNPKYPDKPITIFQILTHTSSIQDGRAYNHSYACGDPAISLNDWIYDNLNSAGKYYDEGSNFGDWPPGGKEKYSNVAFGLLGLIVEKVAKQPFNEYCKENIFEPLGMKNSGWFLSEIDSGNHVRPYGFLTESNRAGYMNFKQLFPAEKEFAVGSFVEGCLYSFPNYPDGLVRTSVRELSYYLIAMMNGGELNGQRILNKETVDKMLALQIKGNDNQGLCWYKTTLNEEIALWGHNGADPGVRTNMFFHPKDKIGVITFQNNSTDGAFEILKELYLSSK